MAKTPPPTSPEIQPIHQRNRSLLIKRFLEGALLSLALFSWSSSALAEDLCSPNPACSALDNRAELAFRTHDYAGAITANRNAFALTQEPRLILNIGRCHHKLGRYKEALSSYAQYGKLVPSPEPEMRETRDRFVKEAEAALLVQEASGSTGKTPVYKKWWFWTVIGAVVATSIAGGVAGGLSRKEPFSETHEF